MSVAFEGHVGPWTVADVEALGDAGDHSRYELLTPGVLTVTPAPGLRHQRASRRLANLLDHACAAQPLEVFEAISVEVPGGRLLVPDIAIVAKDVAAAAGSRCPASAVSLVVEIVSPGSEPNDRLVKPQVYAAAGILAFWQFEFDPTPHIVAHELRAGNLVQVAVAFGGQATRLAVASGAVEVDPADLVRPI